MYTSNYIVICIQQCWLSGLGEDFDMSVTKAIATDPAFYYNEIGYSALNDIRNNIVNMSCVTSKLEKRNATFTFDTEL